MGIIWPMMNFIFLYSSDLICVYFKKYKFIEILNGQKKYRKREDK
jgi:hypothetical protein